MTALSSGFHFISGLAVYFGTVPALNIAKPNAKRMKRRRRSVDSDFTPLSKRQKKELLDSIREDDWFE